MKNTVTADVPTVPRRHDGTVSKIPNLCKNE